MTEFDKERYNELKEIIDNERFDEIRQFIDYKIINKTDLKEKMIGKLLESSNVSYDELTDYFTFLNYNNNCLINNEKNLDLYLKKAIDYGEYPEDVINHSVKDSQKYLDYFYEKIKDSSYRIKIIPVSMKVDPDFINYCLEHKNLSVLALVVKYFNFLDKEITGELYRRVVEIQKEGHGFFLSEPYDYLNHLLVSYDIDNYDELFINNLKCGYVSGYINKYLDNTFDFDVDDRQKKVIDILKDLVDNDKELFFEKKYPGFIPSYIIDELVKYVLINKKTKYISLLRLIDRYDFSVVNKELLHRLVLEDTSIYRNDCRNFFFLFNKNEVLEKFLDEGKLDIVFLNTEMDFLIDHVDVIKKKILDSNYYFNNNNTIELLLDMEDYSLISSVVEANYENLFVIMNYINHDKYCFYTKELYNSIREYLADYFKLNIDHLDRFVSKFDYDVIGYIENSNIQNAINLDEDSFNKYMNLFDIKDLNIEDVKNIYDSLSQARFKALYKSDVKRLDRIKAVLSKKGSELPIDDIRTLASNIDIHKLRKITTTKNERLFTEEELMELESKPYDYLIELCKEITDGKNVDRNLTILYNINRQYIKDKREEFRGKNNYIDEVDVVVDYDEKSLRDAFARSLFYGVDSRFDCEKDLYKILDDLDCRNYVICDEIDNESIILMVILFLRTNGKEYNTDLVRKNVKKVKEILRNSDAVNELMELDIDNKVVDKYKLYDVKKRYKPGKKKSYIYSIIKEVNPFELRDTVFIDKEKEDALVKFLKKYKLVYWEDTFKKALNKDKIELDNLVVAKMISKYNEIFIYIKDMKDKGKDANLTDIVKFGSILSASSDRYALLFGKKDARLIKLNPPPLDSPVSEGREETAVEDYYGLYQRKEITIPPIDEDIVINKKKYHINIGNFTNPINLTYGERTGSCMRIGGIGETLYRFCQNNPNGFHVRITNPSTGELITRVSGFRNGNSVFLNQLRKSLDSNYSDTDIINVIKEVASMMVDNSRDSSFPIENVFISLGEAMMSSDGVDFVNVEEDIKRGFPYFYFDFHKAGLCLKTTSLDNDYVPINTSGKEVPYYKVLRDTVRFTEDSEEIYIAINKYRMLKEILETKRVDSFISTELLSIDETSKIVCLISGEDFIVYLDENLEIHSDYIERDDDRVKLEIKDAIDVLNRKREEYMHERRNRNSR